MTAFDKNGQKAWYHDEGFAGGFFHTYDAISFDAGSTPRKIHVFLPSDYEESERQYPVLYFQDGHQIFWNETGGRGWNVGRTLSELYELNQTEKVIIVAIYPLDRDYEYTHTEWAEGKSHGGLQGYANYVANVLKKWIDTTYRTVSTRESTGVIGSGHGGLASFYIATRFPHLFGFGGCLSSSFWVGMDILPDPWMFRDSISFTHIQFFKPPIEKSPLLQQVRDILANKAVRPKLWIDWGLRRDNEFQNAVLEKMCAEWSQELVQLLVDKFGYERGKDLYVHVDPIGGHDEDAWAHRFGLIMRWLFPRPQEEHGEGEGRLEVAQGPSRQVDGRSIREAEYRNGPTRSHIE